VLNDPLRFQQDSPVECEHLGNYVDAFRMRERAPGSRATCLPRTLPLTDPRGSRAGVAWMKLAFFDLTVCPGRASLCLPREECGRTADSLRVTETVRAVPQMGRSELVSEWKAQFGAPPPPKLRVELMRPILVYRIQENAWGLSGPRRKGRIQDLASEANRRS
jgi:hypothetical protein